MAGRGLRHLVPTRRASRAVPGPTRHRERAAVPAEPLGPASRRGGALPHRLQVACALELDDPGFHHSVLSDFRERLAEAGRADALFDIALARLKDAGLGKARGRQRTDSTYLLASVRELTRLELVLEAVRAALEETARDAPELLDGLVTEDWALR
nr:transposase [Streptomyces morookaense]